MGRWLDGWQGEFPYNPLWDLPRCILETCPGMGPKTTALFCGYARGEVAIPVDTHVMAFLESKGGYGVRGALRRAGVERASSLHAWAERLFLALVPSGVDPMRYHWEVWLESYQARLEKRRPVWPSMV